MSIRFQPGRLTDRAAILSTNNDCLLPQGRKMTGVIEEVDRQVDHGYGSLDIKLRRFQLFAAALSTEVLD